MLLAALVAGCAAGGRTQPAAMPIVIHVALNGSDGNDGAAERGGSPGTGPVRTLERARDVARRLRTSGKARGGVEIAIGPGTYVLPRSLALGPEDSGTEAGPTVFRPEAGASVRISGGASLAWREAAGGELVADWPGACPQQLFVGDERRFRPRLPASGSFPIGAVDPQVADDQPLTHRFIARYGDLPAGFAPAPDTEIVIIAAWTASRLRVSGYDPVSRRVETSGRFAGHGVHRDLAAGMPWYIDNAPGALAPGQWRCEASGGVLRYRPQAGEKARSLSAVAPSIAQLLTIKGARGRPVEHIVWKDIEFANSAWALPPDGWAAMQAEAGLPAAIEAADCRALTFDRIAVRHTGASGIIIGPGCEDVRISDSRLADIGGSGIAIGSDQRKPVAGSDWAGGSTGRRETRRIAVTGTDLRGLGRVQPAGVGIWVGQASHVTLSGNHIADLYYSGISLGWVWSTEPNLSHDNTVTDNVIEQFGQGVLSDFGGIYTLGRQDRTLIARNRIRDGAARDYGGQGLYADEGSAGITFRDNLVERVSHAGVQISHGSEIIVADNRFRDVGMAVLYCNRASEGHSVQFRNNRYEGAQVPATKGVCGHPSYAISNLRFARDGRETWLDKTFGTQGRGPDYVPD